MPLKDAGIYHLGTGTWTRIPGSTANLGPDVIYRSDAPSGYFGIGWENAEGVDEGILPGAGNPNHGAPLDEYCINGFQFGYCSASAMPVDWSFRFYESYFPCDDPDFPINCIAANAGFSTTGLPSAGFCWIVTVDLTGAGEFAMIADGGTCQPGYQGSASGLDHFGWGAIWHTQDGASTGPLLWGHDPLWVPEGEGTCYDPVFTNTCGGQFSSALGTQDLFAIGTPFNGCFFFGGYANTNGCGGPSQLPGAQFAMTLFTDCTSSTCGGDDPPFDPEPDDVFAVSGDTVQFVAVAPGATGYQWYQDEGILAGETSSTLTLASVDPGDNSNYFVVATGLSPSSSIELSRGASLVVDSLCGADDVLEPNDTVSTFRAITTDVTHVGLCVAEDDMDVYATRVPDSTSLQVDLEFFHVDGNIDIFMWDFETHERLDLGVSGNDNESVFWFNATGECRGVLWQVVLRDEEGGANRYKMVVTGADTCLPTTIIGRHYCATRMNSSGYSAQIAAVGSNLVIANNLTLGATQMPIDQFGYFITSPRPGFIPGPGGSAGALCVSGGILRFSRPGEVLNAGFQGRFALKVDLTDFPSGNSVSVGDTWYFQAWFRDGMTSNFTNGVGVTFE